MKQRYFLLLILTSFIGFAQCPTGPINFTTQAEIDAFPINFPGCAILDFDLSVSGNDIVDLTPFSQLTSIVGLNIWNTSLQNLSGLENLSESSAQAFITIWDNPQLTDISALSNLNSFVALDTVDIRNNPLLTSLEGLEGITELLDLFIFNNASLIDFTGLSSLSNVLNAMVINGNSNLTNMNGLDNIVDIEELLITGNPSLIDFEGLTGSIQIGGLQITNNNALQNLFGLQSINNIGAIFIQDNDNLSNISALTNAQIDTDIGAGIGISNNPNLSECSIVSLCNAISVCNSNPGSCSITIENNALTSGCNSPQEVTLGCGIPITNDECEDAIVIPLDEIIVANNLDATQSIQVPGCNDSPNRIDVWFTFTTSDGGIFDIVVEGGTYNLQVWEGDCNTLTQVPNTCAVNQLLDADININTTYYLQVWSDELSRASGAFTVSVGNTVLSTEEEIINSFTLFPNPSNAIINYRSNDIVDKISVYNAVGQQVLDIAPNSAQGTIDISNLSSGLYFVKTSVEEKQKTFKIIKD